MFQESVQYTAYILNWDPWLLEPQSWIHCLFPPCFSLCALSLSKCFLLICRQVIGAKRIYSFRRRFKQFSFWRSLNRSPNYHYFKSLMTIEFDTSRDVQKTLGLIKPDAVDLGFEDEIKERIVSEGFTIIRSQKLTLSREKASLFYREHDGKPFFEGLLDFMTSGPIVVLVLSRHDAIREWRTLMGPTDVNLAKETLPKSLRALYGTSKTYNAVHGSDSVNSARREIKFFYPSSK